jgi:GxxExxY protein
MQHEAVTGRIIGAAIHVHKVVGPGLLESAYQSCLAAEMRYLGLGFREQAPLALVYRDVALDCSYRLDFDVEDRVVVEVKACDAILPVHRAQLLTYLRLSRRPVGLLLNFHVKIMKDGIERIVLHAVD